jgi:glycolate oxidase
MDGNLHTMLITENGTATEQQLIHQAATEIYSFAIELGGVISGEHGIGMLQKEFMVLQFSEDQLGLMQGIKKLLDPREILNPGKFL